MKWQVANSLGDTLTYCIVILMKTLKNHKQYREKERDGERERERERERGRQSGRDRKTNTETDSKHIKCGYRRLFRQHPKPGTNSCGYAKFVCLALEHNEKQTFWSSFV